MLELRGSTIGALFWRPSGGPLPPPPEGDTLAMASGRRMEAEIRRLLRLKKPEDGLAELAAEVEVPGVGPVRITGHPDAVHPKPPRLVELKATAAPLKPMLVRAAAQVTAYTWIARVCGHELEDPLVGVLRYGYGLAVYEVGWDRPFVTLLAEAVAREFTGEPFDGAAHLVAVRRKFVAWGEDPGVPPEEEDR